MGKTNKKRAARQTPAGKRRGGKVQAKAAALTHRQQRAAAALVGDAKGIKTAALKQAGFSDATAEHHQKRVFGRPAVQTEIRKLLSDKGLTEEHAALRLYECTNAEVTRYHQGISLGDHVAHDVRLEAVRTFFQLTGRLTNKVEIEVVVKQFTEHIVLVVEKYVPTEQRAQCLDEIIAVLQSAGRN